MTWKLSKYSPQSKSVVWIKKIFSLKQFNQYKAFIEEQFLNMERNFSNNFSFNKQQLTFLYDMK